jgi:Na+/proline symporter
VVLAVAMYSLLGGLWGVTITDFIQFGIAMTGSVLLAVFAVKAPGIGSMSALKAKLPEWMFSFVPTITNDAATNASGAGHALALTVSAFLAYITIQWWASWYPGAEPGGGGYIAQRMMSAKNEKHSVLAALWFNIAHYCLRPWPWIIAALASVVLYPELTNARAGYVMLIREHLPVGVRGLLVASFLAAFMSTISTQLNWGASYLVNDLWHRFIDKSGNEGRLVMVSRVTTMLLAIFSMGVMYNLDTINMPGSSLLPPVPARPVLVLRWYWWASMSGANWSRPVVRCCLLRFHSSGFGAQQSFPDNLYLICGITTVTGCWSLF